MAQDEHDDRWGDHTARLTFIWTVIGAAVFAGTVFLFIL